MVHYGFSKAAQLVIARGAAELTKGSNVTVNSVMPGPTWVGSGHSSVGHEEESPYPHLP